MTEKFTLLRNAGVIESANKWNLELNYGQWHDNEIKYDLRAWSLDHSQCGKGVTLTESEALQLLAILSKEIQEGYLKAEKQ